MDKIEQKGKRFERDIEKTKNKPVVRARLLKKMKSLKRRMGNE